MSAYLTKGREIEKSQGEPYFSCVPRPVYNSLISSWAASFPVISSASGGSVRSQNIYMEEKKGR